MTNEVQLDGIGLTQMIRPVPPFDMSVAPTDGQALVWNAAASKYRPGGGASLAYNVKDYGARGDGTTDDTAAIAAAIAALPTVNVFGNANPVLYFPPGRYITSGGHAFANRVNLRGAGRYISMIYAKSGSTADLLTFNAIHSGISDLTVDGARVTSGDSVVFNAAYGFVDQCTVANAPGNGVSIGKVSGAIACIISNSYILNCAGYGIRVYAGTSTDGMFANLDIGPSGLSGVRLDAPGQNLVNVHAWGSGIESNTDRSGFYGTTDHCHFANCEAETNRGDGFHFEGGSTRGNTLTGCYSWGNNAAGVYAYTTSGGIISGCEIYNNGCNNTTSSTAVTFAGILLDISTNWTITGNNIYDTAAAVPAGSYGTTPTFPYSGRSAIRTQTNAYAETGASDFNCLSGNLMRSEQTFAGVSAVVVGNNELWGDNQLGANAAPTVTAAATISPRPHCRLQRITGSTTITNITAYAAGREITLAFIDATPGSITDGGNLRLAGSFTPTTDDTLSLICDGTNWYETARSAN